MWEKQDFGQKIDELQNRRARLLRTVGKYIFQGVGMAVIKSNILEIKGWIIIGSTI